MLSQVFGLPLSPVGAGSLCQRRQICLGWQEGWGRQLTLSIPVYVVTSGCREVKPSETLLSDMVGHGLLMPAVLQLLDSFCKCHKKEY